MSNQSNTAPNRSPTRNPRLRRATVSPIRFPEDDLVNYRQSRSPDLGTRAGQQPIPNRRRNIAVGNGIVDTEEEPFSVPGPRTRRSPSPIAPRDISQSPTVAASSDEEDNNPSPQEDRNVDVAQTNPPATRMYARLNRLVPTWICRCYPHMTAPFRFIFSMTIVRLLSFICHFRTRRARSPAQEQAMKEERERWSTWCANVFIPMAMVTLFFFWSTAYVVDALSYYFIVSFSYLYGIFGSITSMLPVTNASVNGHVNLMKSSYEIQQQDIDNLWTLFNDHDARITELRSKLDQSTDDNYPLQLGNLLAGKLQDNVMAIIEKWVNKVGTSTPSSISQSLKTVFDLNSTDTLAFSHEFVEHIKKDPHLQQLLRTTKHTAENILYESVESFFAQNQQSIVNYADGTQGAFILYQITSNSHPTKLWHYYLKMHGLSHVYDEPWNTILPNSHCWTMEGKAGTLGIGLTAPAVVEQLAIEIAPHEDDLELFHFEVYSLPSYPASSSKSVLLGNFTSDGSLQTFDIDSDEKVPAVMIKILETEHSAPKKTICNVKVFGSADN